MCACARVCVRARMRAKSCAVLYVIQGLAMKITVLIQTAQGRWVVLEGNIMKYETSAQTENIAAKYVYIIKKKRNRKFH